MSSSEFQQLTPIEHMLKYPDLTLGDTTIQLREMLLLDLDMMKIRRQDIPYSSALERIFLEILYNAADNVERSRLSGIDVGQIYVNMSQDKIQIKNEGRPIPCGKQPGTSLHIPEFIFGELRTSSNYDSSQVRKVGGRNGLGSKATNIYSVYFSLDIVNCDEGVRYSQVWKNNMSYKSEPKISSLDKLSPTSQKSYTSITFIPDFARFYDEDNSYGFAGRRNFTYEMLDSFTKHCADVSATAGVSVIVNKVKIDCSGSPSERLTKYASLYFGQLPNHLIFESPDSMAILVDSPDTGSTISFVNAVINEEGGIHVQKWKKDLYAPIFQHLKKYKVKESDINNHISLILMCRLLNPKYRSQTKDKLTAPAPTVNVGSELKQILSWNGIKKLEEELKAKQNQISKITDGKKTKNVAVENLKDAQEAGGPESLKCTLYITEGVSAKAFAVKGIENGNYFGVLPIKGKLLNVGTCSIDQYTSNEEIIALKKVLGLQEDMDYTQEGATSTLRYGRLVVLSDQDVDGMHIRGLVLNFFRIKFPSLIEIGFVQIMETPLLRVTYKGQMLSFYYQREYDMWVQGRYDPEEDEYCDADDVEISESEIARRKSLTVHYYKGLGKSQDDEIDQAFKEGRLITYRWDDKAEHYMSVIFNENFEDERKDILMSWDPIEKVGKQAEEFPRDSISYFCTNQLCEFSFVNTGRTIPKLDGLKECQRKVLTVVRRLTKPKKVSQLKGLISDQMHYRYGDNALYETIVGMGSYCVGTNNIPLIQAIGQYRSREASDKAGADRYIEAFKPEILEYIFRKEDDCILEYRYEGSDQIEPKCYFPIVPPFLINGALGIGSGFSTRIPNYKPETIIEWIWWWLQGKKRQQEEMPILKPWWRNYQGKIERIGNAWYSIGSFRELPSRKKVKDILVTELPVTQTIATYKKKLDKMMQTPMSSTDKTPQIKSYKDSKNDMKYKIKGKVYTEILPNITIEGAVYAITHHDGPLRALGLMEKISDTNIVLLDEEDKPHPYSDIYEAFDAFCKMRYKAYQKRKQTLIEEWNKQIERLQSKRQFIKDILDGVLILKGKSDREVLLEMSKKGYEEVFLTKTSMATLTEDGIRKIDNEIRNLQEKIDNYNKTTVAAMWARELKELYDKI